MPRLPGIPRDANSSLAHAFKLLQPGGRLWPRPHINTISEAVRLDTDSFSHFEHACMQLCDRFLSRDVKEEQVSEMQLQPSLESAKP